MHFLIPPSHRLSNPLKLPIPSTIPFHPPQVVIQTIHLHNQFNNWIIPFFSVNHILDLCHRIHLHHSYLIKYGYGWHYTQKSWFTLFMILIIPLSAARRVMILARTVIIRAYLIRQPYASAESIGTDMYIDHLRTLIWWHCMSSNTWMTRDS